MFLGYRTELSQPSTTHYVLLMTKQALALDEFVLGG